MFKICTDDIFEISKLDREIHHRFKKLKNFDDFSNLNRWLVRNKIDDSEVLKSVIKVEKQLTVLCVFWCATIIGVIATICYTLPYLWPELYE